MRPEAVLKAQVLLGVGVLFGRRAAWLVHEVARIYGYKALRNLWREPFLGNRYVQTM